MTVFVDDMYQYPMGQFRRGPRLYKMSHMVSDVGDEELHAMARKIGVDTKWFQNKGKVKDHPDNHYNITMTKREEAIKAGAVPITMRELGESVRARRAARVAALQPVAQKVP